MLAANVRTVAVRVRDGLPIRSVYPALHGAADPWKSEGYAARVGTVFDAILAELGGYRSSLSDAVRAAYERGDLPDVLDRAADRIAAA